MPELPVSARTALWTTVAWSDGMSLQDALRRAVPDLDHLGSGLDTLQAWQDLGEQALLLGTPAPGDLSRLPTCDPETAAAAAEAGECVFVAGVGGLLVPAVTAYGSGTGLDQGWRVDWQAYPAAPLPRHRVEALDAGQVERDLRQALLEATTELDALGGQPFAGRAAHRVAEARLDADWALPEGIPQRALRAIRTAATVSTLCHAGLDGPDDALDARTGGRRRAVLMRLERVAEQGLADAVNSACAALAGWVPARD